MQNRYQGHPPRRIHNNIDNGKEDVDSIGQELPERTDNFYCRGDYQLD